MKPSRILGIIFGLILLLTGVSYFFPNIAPAFGKSLPTGNPWAILFIIGGGTLVFFDVLNGATDFFQKIFPGSKKTEISYDIHSPNNIRNRANVIANVKESWIKGVYENNLQTAARIELELQDFPEALARPNWHLRLQATQSRAISSNTPIRQIFDESGQALLILGDPGSGKTFTMLELVDALLKEVKPENDKPLPVVLNLSSWARERKPLEEWIVADLKQQYQLAEKVTHAWVEHEQLALMLDGLDEVDESHRDNCADTINSFKEEHGCPLVVCSRTKDYDQLASRLNLTRAIEIQELTDKQIDDFLSNPGLQLQAVRETILSDTDLRDLATTPLILNVMTLAYRGLKKEDLPKLASIEGRRKHLFNTYIRRMFVRRPLPIRNGFTQHQALGWLTYLARQLHRRSETKLLIENLQLDWLPQRDHRRYWVLNGVLGGLLGGLSFGLFFGLFGLFFGVFGGLLVGLGLLGGLLGGLFLGLFFGVFGLFSGVLVGLLSGFSVRLFGGLFDAVSRGQLVFGLPNVRPVDSIAWHPPRRESFGKALVIGLLFGLFTRLSFGLFTRLSYGLINIEYNGLFVGLLSGLFGGLAFLIRESFVPVESLQQNMPNRGIRHSIKNVIRYTIIFGLFGGLSVGLFDGVPSGLGFGLFGGLFFGLTSPAGEAVIRHYTLRWMLHQGKYLPLTLVLFLETMKDRILLRRVGGGYIFLHRMLLEHFASLSDDELAALAKE